jgi:hypothetical protein
VVGCFPQKIRIAAAIGLARISVPFFSTFEVVTIAEVSLRSP